MEHKLKYFCRTITPAGEATGWRPTLAHSYHYTSPNGSGCHHRHVGNRVGEIWVSNYGARSFGSVKE